MIDEIQTFIERFVARAHPVESAMSLAWWDAATTGSEESKATIERLTREWMELFTVPGEWEQVRGWRERAGEIEAPLLRRQLELLYLAFAGSQLSPGQIARISALEADLNHTFSTFRGSIDGKELSDNEILEIFATSGDSEEARDAWEASKQIGPVVAGRLLELVRVRNEAARQQGYRDFYAQSLALQEVDETALFALLDELEATTREPFRQLKARVDAELAARYRVPAEELRPWHYADPFFQRAPHVGSIDLDEIYAGEDIVELSLRSFDAQGLEVRDILARSDLYERPNKNQHAFCTHIDRTTDDVRILCNLRPTTSWMDTQLHELGHAVYDKYLAPDLPYLLRGPAHTNTTEAIAMLMGRQARLAPWLEHVRGLAPERAQHYAQAARQEQQLSQILFVRWALVMAYFERALYADPDRPDLGSLWWELVERFQLLRRPESRAEPDWATKIHLAISPVYYHNYMLGELTASQLEAHIGRAAGSYVANPATGQILRDELFALGRRYPWDETLREVTGEPLTPRYFVAQFVDR